MKTYKYGKIYQGDRGMTYVAVSNKGYCVDYDWNMELTSIEIENTEDGNVVVRGRKVVTKKLEENWHDWMCNKWHLTLSLPLMESTCDIPKSNIKTFRVHVKRTPLTKENMIDRNLGVKFSRFGKKEDVVGIECGYYRRKAPGHIIEYLLKGNVCIMDLDSDNTVMMTLPGL